MKTTTKSNQKQKKRKIKFIRHRNIKMIQKLNERKKMFYSDIVFLKR